jgi:hypothetical protein
MAWDKIFILDKAIIKNEDFISNFPQISRQDGHAAPAIAPDLG